MKKTFKLIDLDCANCAAKMENAIKRLTEWRTPRILIPKNDCGGRRRRFDDIMKQIVKACKKRWSRTARLCCEHLLDSVAG